MLEVRVNTATPQQWDAFAHSAVGAATYAHLYGWKGVIENAYGHEALYYEAWDRGELVGVVPTVVIKSALFGRQMVSMPYLDTGGVLSHSAEYAGALINELVKKTGQDRTELCLRSITRSELGLPMRQDKVTMYLMLGASAEETFKKFSSERRNRIKRAAKNGLAATFHKEESLDEFYRIFSENMRDLGSPVHSKQFFAEVLRAFPDKTGIIIVRRPEGTPIGAGLYFAFNGVLALPWVSSLRNWFKLYPNIMLYWELIKWGCERGIQIFDFGRSTVDSGTFEFKRQWGAEPVQLYWSHYSSNGGKSSVHQDAQTRKNQLMIQLWKRLPLGVANTIGPRLRKQIAL